MSGTLQAMAKKPVLSVPTLTMVREVLAEELPAWQREHLVARIVAKVHSHSDEWAEPKAVATDPRGSAQ